MSRYTGQNQDNNNIMAKDKSGYIIAAAFIGPGTVTTASIAGAQFGFHLGWALLFSVFATLILQDMAARLGLATRAGLSDALTAMPSSTWLKRLLALLVVSAIGVGNAAYESGNLTGAAIGLNTFADLGTGTWAMILGILAALLLWSGKYKLIESVLVVLVFTMAVVFIVTLFVAGPDWSALTSQFLTPALDISSITLVLALIGTTIVPYNLFLHASLVAQQYKDMPLAQAMAACRKQSAVAIAVGGLITLVIMATAMTTFYQQAIALEAGNMGAQLAPVLGEYASWIFGLGLFAAGLTSAITAPLAAAYAVCGALNQPADMNAKVFRSVWLVIIVVGVAIAGAGFKPLAAIIFAQATNGVLLPVVAIFLLLVMNRHNQLGEFRNRTTSNLFGLLVVGVVVALGGYKLVRLFFA